MGIRDRLSHAWNAFRFGDDPYGTRYNTSLGMGSSRPNHSATRRWSSSSLSKTIFNRIATDCSMVDISHVKVGKDGTTQSVMNSKLQRIFDTEANIDQNSRDFIHEVVYSMLDEGVVALVPTDTTSNPERTDGFDVESVRVGRITQWFPKHVRVDLYNEATGVHEEVTLEKRFVVIVNNPFFEVVNDENSTLKRLIRKLELLDRRDEEISSGKFNMIIQLPYTIRNKLKKDQAQERLQELESQLGDSKYGVAYTDGTEKIVQLNRPIDNDLADQIKYLQDQFYNQLGMTANIFNGTASESEMRNYYNRAIDPIITVLIAEIRRKWLSKTARSQGQDLVFHRDPFKLVPVEQLAKIADTFTRNAILTSNEVRKIVGFGPSTEPIANQLSNKNIADANQLPPGQEGPVPDGQTLLIPPDDDSNQNGGEA